MRKTFLALSFLVLALLGALIFATGLGLAQQDGQADGVRPTPTAVGGRAAPASVAPDTPSLPDLVVESIEVLKLTMRGEFRNLDGSLAEGQNCTQRRLDAEKIFEIAGLTAPSPEGPEPEDEDLLRDTSCKTRSKGSFDSSG